MSFEADRNSTYKGTLTYKLAYCPMANFLSYTSGIRRLSYFFATGKTDGNGKIFAVAFSTSRHCLLLYYFVALTRK